MKKVFAEVYGCPSNIADYEMALGLLKEAGFEIANSSAEADINIIFTCIVKNPTEHRMIQKIQEFTKIGKPLIVAGCMPKTSQRAIENINPDASLVGPDSIIHIADVARLALEGKKVIFIADERKPKLGLPRARKDRTVAIIPISIGCMSDCAYCATKFARGRLCSYPAEKIVDEVRAAVKDGCSEVWLTSQDNGCYGLDIGTDLPTLLKEVCSINGNFTVRVGMMNPVHAKKIVDELIEAYKNKKIQKFLHLPVQSGSDRILRAMKRGYMVRDFTAIVEKFRAAFPDLALSTDIIVGFPGETEKDFQSTVELLEKIKPEKVNMSKFGARPGTEAAKLKQLPPETISERSRRLHEIMKM